MFKSFNKPAFVLAAGVVVGAYLASKYDIKVDVGLKRKAS